MPTNYQAYPAQRAVIAFLSATGNASYYSDDDVVLLAERLGERYGLGGRTTASRLHNLLWCVLDSVDGRTKQGKAAYALLNACKQIVWPLFNIS